MICLEAWAKWAQWWLVCASLHRHLEPINIFNAVGDNIIIINCTIRSKERTVRHQIRNSLSLWCTISAYQKLSSGSWTSHGKSQTSSHPPVRIISQFCLNAWPAHHPCVCHHNLKYQIIGKMLNIFQMVLYLFTLHNFL